MAEMENQASEISAARRRFMEAMDKWEAKVRSSVSEGITKKPSRAHIEPMRAAVSLLDAYMDSLQKAANDYLKGARTNAKWMRAATIVIALSTFGYLVTYYLVETQRINIQASAQADVPSSCGGFAVSGFARE